MTLSEISDTREYNFQRFHIHWSVFGYSFLRSFFLCSSRDSVALVVFVFGIQAHLHPEVAEERLQLEPEFLLGLEVGLEPPRLRFGRLLLLPHGREGLVLGLELSHQVRVGGHQRCDLQRANRKKSGSGKVENLLWGKQIQPDQTDWQKKFKFPKLP